MDSKPAEDLWAVVETASKIFIGIIDEMVSEEGDVLDGQSRVRAAICRLDPIVLKTAYVITSMNIPVRMPDNKIAFNQETSAQPYLLSFEKCLIRIQPVSIILFSDMSEGDRARYKVLAKQAEDLSTKARAVASGIIPPK